MTSTPPNTCSLVVTTYNWPEALDKVLQSVAWQTARANEVIVADDGSTEATQALVERWKKTMPNLAHAWQEDEGFRAARSRNNAIARTSGDYVVVIDGDMILHPQFIEDHLAFAQRGSFVQGRRVALTREGTAKFLQSRSDDWDEQLAASCARKPWKLKRNRLLRSLFDIRQRNARKVRTCNMGFWRDDLVAVNGFDNDYVGWGREDSDLAWRLVNAGLEKRHLRFAAVALHLYHDELSRESLPQNEARLKRAMTNRSYVRCANGLEQVTPENTPRDATRPR